MKQTIGIIAIGSSLLLSSCGTQVSEKPNTNVVQAANNGDVKAEDTTIKLSKVTRIANMDGQEMYEYEVVEDTPIFNEDNEQIGTVQKGNHAFVAIDESVDLQSDQIKILTISDKYWKIDDPNKRRMVYGFIGKEALSLYHPQAPANLEEAKPIEEMDVIDKPEYATVEEYANHYVDIIEKDAPEYFASQQQYEIGMTQSAYIYAKHFANKTNDDVLKTKLQAVEDTAHVVFDKEMEKEKHNERYEKFVQAFKELQEYIQ